MKPGEIESRLGRLAERIRTLEASVHGLNIGPPRQNYPDSNGPNNQAGEKSERTPSGMISTPAPQTTYQGSDAKPEPKPWWRSWMMVERIGIFAAIVVAGVNTLQWRDANRNFKTEQRAWLTVSLPPNNAPIAVGSLSEHHFIVTNTGKTAAKGANGEFVTVALRITEAPRFNYDHGTRIRYPILYPSVPQDGVSELIISGIPKSQPRRPIIVDSQFISDFTQNKIYMVTYGRLRYQDVFGGEHWTHICAVSSTMIVNGIPKMVPGCVEYNDSGDGSDSQ
jgi:hypothetical protein